MKSKIFAITLITIALITIVSFIGWFILKPSPYIMQGEVQATSYKISSQMAGRVDSLTVRRGDIVERGQLLCVIRSKTVDSKLTQAEALHQAAEAQNTKVDRGAREQQKAQAYQQWQQAKAGQELATQTFNRVKNLYDDGVVTAQKFDEAEALLKSAISTERMAQAQYSLVEQGAQWEDKNTAKALVNQAQGGVSEVESYLTDGWQYAPISGEVASIMAQKGELVGAGFPIITLVDMNDSWVSFNLKETMLPKIKIGTQINGYLPALDRTVTLRVSYIAAEASYSTWAATRTSGEFDIRTFQVQARPTSPIPELRAGMSVTVDYNSL